MPDTDVLIIGAGISGLSVAWGLARRGVRVEVWESEQRAGGKIRTVQDQGYTTEQAASLLLNFRPEVDQFIRDAGLQSYKVGHAQAKRGKRYLVQNGQLQPVPTQLTRLLFSPLWSWGGKLRMMSEAFMPSHPDDAESVAQFIRRRLGSEMLEKAIDPFVAGTLASIPDNANASATLPRLTALERRYGSITAGVLANRILRRKTAHVSETFSFDGGMQRLTRQLARTRGISLRTNHCAQEIIPDRGLWRVQGVSKNGDVRRCVRHLVLSTPAAATSHLIEPVDKNIAQLLGSIAYAPMAVVHMGFERERIAHPLDGTGFLTPKREQLSMNGNLWLGSLFPDRAPHGHTLLTSYMGGARHPQRADWSEQRLSDALLEDLQRLLGISGHADYLRIDRHPQALPLYHGDYSGRMRTLSAALHNQPGLHLAANYRGGVSIRDRITEGLHTAEDIHGALPTDGARTGMSFPAALAGIPGA